MLQEEAAEAREELFAVAEEETSADVLRLTPDEEDSVEEASDALQTCLRNHQQVECNSSFFLPLLWKLVLAYLHG